MTIMTLVEVGPCTRRLKPLLLALVHKAQAQHMAILQADSTHPLVHVIVMHKIWDIFHLTACGVMQEGLEEKEVQLQNQAAMNQQLMKRKEDMEWQLMSVLAKVQACHLQAESCVNTSKLILAPPPPPRP